MRNERKLAWICSVKTRQDTRKSTNFVAKQHIFQCNCSPSLLITQANRTSKDALTDARVRLHGVFHDIVAAGQAAENRQRKATGDSQMKIRNNCTFARAHTVWRTKEEHRSRRADLYKGVLHFTR